MSDEPVIVQRSGACTTIMLNRPHRLNALDTATHYALEDALNRFSADPTQRVCVIKGAGGRAFCAGSDLKHLAEIKAAGEQANYAYPPHGYAGLIERFDLNKPIIAAVDGIAFGGGFEIVLACDLVIATPQSRFALPEPKIGAVAIAGGVHRLARQTGLKQAMAIALTGEPISAEEAYRLGLINEIVPPDALNVAVEKWVGKLLQNAPTALAATKQMLMRGLDEADLRSAIQQQATYDAFVAWEASGDAWEGAEAFAQKRKPSWLD